MVFLIHILF